MVEQVARALYRKNNPSSSDAKVDEHWRVLADMARWAIEAMRAPTEEMTKAGSSHQFAAWYGEEDFNDSLPDHLVNDIYRTMIDAALSKP